MRLIIEKDKTEAKTAKGHLFKLPDGFKFWVARKNVEEESESLYSIYFNANWLVKGADGTEFTIPEFRQNYPDLEWEGSR